MRLALGFNPVLSMRDAAKLASQAESMGYESIWIHESLFQRDVVSYISCMASGTTRIQLGSGAINTFTRHPVTAAATFASLSEMSEGRVTLGLALGSFPTIPLIGHQIFPVEKTHPLRRIKEYVEVVRMVWEGGKVDFDGLFFQVHNLTLGFKVEKRIPLYIASLSPKTQAFAASTADGVILSPALNTAEGTAKMVENVARGESRRGQKVERASYLMTSVDPDPAKAVEVVRNFYFFAYQLAEVVSPSLLEPWGVKPEQLAPLKAAWKRGDVAEAQRLIPREAVEALTVAGGPDHAFDRLKEYEKAGVTLPIVMPIGNIPFAMRELAPSGN